MSRNIPLELRKRVMLLISEAIRLPLLLLGRLIRLSLRWRWRKRKARWLSVFRPIYQTRPEKALSMVLEVAESFPLPIVEDVLDELRSWKLAGSIGDTVDESYHQLRFVDRHVENLKHAKSCSERTRAVERLGQTGHLRSVSPLLSVLQDDAESRDVKIAAIEALGTIRDERAIDLMIEVLGLPDPSTGQPLANLLVKFGEAVCQPLSKVLASSRREMQRLWAVRVLAEVGTVNSSPVLLSALRDRSPEVRAEVATALGRLGVADAEAPLSTMLMEDTFPQVRETAAQALGNIPVDRVPIALKKGIADSDHNVRLASVAAVEKIGKEAAPLFTDLLSSESEEAAALAARALERMGVVEEHIQNLVGAEWKLAWEFLRTIAKHGEVATLARYLTDPRLLMRIRICRALAQGKGSRCRDALAERAKSDPEWVVRLEALLALVNLGGSESDLLTRALDQEEGIFRERLLAALQEIPQGLLDPLAEPVGRLVQDTNLKVRLEAIRVLGKIHSDSVLPNLLSGLSDPAPQVRQEAASVLHNYSNQKVIEPLTSALQDADPRVQAAAARSLGSLKDSRAIRSLANALAKVDGDLWDEIVRALAAIPKEDVFELTVDLLMGLPDQARSKVASAFGVIGDPRAIHVLGTFLDDLEPSVRVSAATALGDLGGEKAVKLLLTRLSDPIGDVRAAVAIALGRCDDSRAVQLLISMLKTEGDAAVSQCVALSVSCLLNESETNLGELSQQNVSLRNRLIEAVKGRREDGTASRDRAVELITLALLKEDSSFLKILEARHEARFRETLKEILDKLSAVAQKRFFAFLLLDSQLFYGDDEDRIRENYSSLLRSSLAISDRLRATEGLAALKTAASVSDLDTALAKDPSAQVRAAALDALSNVLQGEELVARITQATQNRSGEVWSKAVQILERL